jgi:hypothetical protein
VGLGPAQQVYCMGWSRVYLEARGEVYLGVELETIYLGASKGRQSRHRTLYCIYRSQPETEVSCMAGDGDVLCDRRRRCLVWPEMTVDSDTG